MLHEIVCKIHFIDNDIKNILEYKLKCVIREQRVKWKLKFDKLIVEQEKKQNERLANRHENAENEENQNEDEEDDEEDDEDFRNEKYEEKKIHDSYKNMIERFNRIKVNENGTDNHKGHDLFKSDHHCEACKNVISLRVPNLIYQRKVE